ncbi:magnesium and cobalt transport protein CorA [Aquipluma nitroreducens]|uniref:Magnesium transport protein CorA n=1 Tax=Aquipluma nitroreducens TaxID=2010828 RepID=A0A5K7S7J7_9BACT|nr:magnesium/cobalt transporter CorA [Aquipluma nitroreducens]BBE17541.1 magnesium and cobalt transport protein CorA [Aquipluma nitroreducens]
MARFLNDRKAASGQMPGSLIHLGTKKLEKVRIRLLNYSIDDFVETEPDELDDCMPYIEKDKVSWINIDGLHDAGVIQKLGDLFEIHGLLLEDMLNTDQRPKVTETEKLMIVILKLLEYDEKTDRLSSEQISLILDDSYLITLQEKVGDYFDPIRDRIRKSKGRLRRKGADYLTYALLDTIVDNYLLIIETLGNMIEKTEAQIFTPNQPKGLMQKIYKHKTEINFLRKNVRPVKEILHRLIENESGFIADENMKYFQDLNDLVMQATESIEIYQMMLNDQMNIYHANLDSKANEIMKVLTVFSAFFIPLTFVAGVYGMNFDNLPELHFKYGYLYFWIILIVITLGLLIYFRKRKWF